MIDPRELEKYRTSHKVLATIVQRELTRFFRTLDLSKPEAVRDALLAYIPILVERYGQVSSTLALEWYEALRLASGDPGAYLPVAAPLPDLPAAITGAIRSAATHLWTPTPEKMLNNLNVKVSKYVREPGRQTMIYNADLEGATWARVPTGATTCTFCFILASRGADYLSEKSAGSERFGEENLFHGDCDCEIIRVGRFEEYPEGYIPKELYDIYDESAKRVGRNDLRAIAADMRRRASDLVTDGVEDDDYLSKTL